MSRLRYHYEAGTFSRDDVELLDENGDPTGQTGELVVEGFDILDARLGFRRPLAFTEDRVAAERIVAALNAMDVL